MIYNGSITIQRDCFAKPEIHEKLKKMPSGRKKLITKRIPVLVEYRQMIADGRIVIENCSHCWKTTEEEPHVDIMACKLLFWLFIQYQEDGKMPETITFLHKETKEKSVFYKLNSKTSGDGEE